MWALRVKTYENQTSGQVLVLEHVFLGKTRAEAFHYSESHSQADAFYTESGGAQAAYRIQDSPKKMALVRGKYKGVHTQSEARWEQI